MCLPSSSPNQFQPIHTLVSYQQGERGFCVTCHCEERSDVAISLILSLSKDANEIATLRSQ